jgi:hypothetical protein
MEFNKNYDYLILISFEVMLPWLACKRYLVIPRLVDAK